MDEASKKCKFEKKSFFPICTRQNGIENNFPSANDNVKCQCSFRFNKLLKLYFSKFCKIQNSKFENC